MFKQLVKLLILFHNNTLTPLRSQLPNKIRNWQANYNSEYNSSENHSMEIDGDRSPPGVCPKLSVWREAILQNVTRFLNKLA